VSVSHLSPTYSSAEILSIYVERSWRSNAQRQLNKGIDFVIGKREDIYLWNLEGTKRVIDCSTAGGVHSLGHRHPEVVAALRGAIDGGRDTGLWSLPNAEYLWLQDKLAELAPSRALDRSVITLSSTTSVDLAAMFAFRFTGRQNLVAYRHGYHGHSGFAALATGSAEEGVIDYYRLPRQYAKFFDTYNALDELAHVLTPDVAALIVEPINYETFEPASKAYFEGVQALCRDRNILFVVDETRTGLGRTGRLWASEHYDIAPDMMIVGKGLSGGLYPASALLMRFDIYERCMNQHDFAYISSLGGNEISCIVAKKVLEVVSQPEFLDHVNRISAVLSRELASVCSRRHNLLSPGVAHGGLFSVRIHDFALASLLYQAIYRHGVLCHSVSVIEPCMLKFLPPLTLDEVGAHEIAEALDRAVQEIGT
jgi:putrescine aminotransferase